MWEEGSAGTDSEFERRVFAAIVGNGLKAPLNNPTLSVNGVNMRPDFYWPDEQVVLEADAFTHTWKMQKLSDRSRDIMVGCLNVRFDRIKQRDFERDERGFIARLRALLDTPPPT
jgi:hypothetical protein